MMAMIGVTGGGSKKAAKKSSPPKTATKHKTTTATKPKTTTTPKTTTPQVGLSAGVKVKQSVFQKAKAAINPVNPNKTGWLKEQVNKRTTVTPLPSKKRR